MKYDGDTYAALNMICEGAHEALAHCPDDVASLQTALRWTVNSLFGMLTDPNRTPDPMPETEIKAFPSVSRVEVMRMMAAILHAQAGWLEACAKAMAGRDAGETLVFTPAELAIWNARP